MISSDTTQVHDDLEQISIRLSRIEESMTCFHEVFSKSYFSEATRSLSIPGFRFIGEKFQHRIHSYLWIFIHSVALLISYAYIKEEYDNWQYSPVVRTLSNNLTFVHEIPFPAVTICFPYFFKSDYDYMQNFQKCMTCNDTAGQYIDCSYNGECDRDEVAALAVASRMCAIEGSDHKLATPSEIYNRDLNISVDGKQFASVVQKVVPTCDVIQRQIIGNEHFLNRCDKNGFQYFLNNGAFGLCITINGISHDDIYKKSTVPSIPIQQSLSDQRYIGKEMTLENMIYYRGGNDTVPAYFTDEYFSFYITEDQNETLTNICSVFSSDELATIAIHNPAEIPLFQNLESMIKKNKYNFFKVVPKIVTTKKDLISYSPIQRGCYYSHERDLMLFKFYSQSNCDAECLVNCSIKVCKCVPLNLPRPSTSVDICVSECKTVTCDCNCLPDCVSLSYDFETKETKVDTNGSGGMIIYYKRNSFYPMIREGINDLSDFMAYSFGILGTFNGFSVMVIFELFYYITFRLWSSIKNYLINKEANL